MLKTLSVEDFVRRTANGRKTPVYREFLADRETPVAILSRVVGDENIWIIEVFNGKSIPIFGPSGATQKLVGLPTASGGEMTHFKLRLEGRRH